MASTGKPLRALGRGYAATGLRFYVWDEEAARVSAFAADLARAERHSALNAGVCAWCGGGLGAANAAPRDRALGVSHGICRGCFDERA